MADGVAGVRHRARPRELDTERDRAWRLGFGERCAVVLCTSTAYVLSVGAVLMLANFAAHLVALWTLGTVN
jgi:hypothetical protein